MSAQDTAVPVTRAPANPAAVLRPWWLADLWWLSTRRQWRQHGGGLLFSAVFAALLASALRAVPEEGEAYYFSLALLLAAGAIVVSPILLTMESVVLSRRLEILPLSPLVRWLGRLLLSNTFRSTLAIVTLIWGGFVLEAHGPGGFALLARSALLLGVVIASLVTSVFIEDAIRHSRAVVLHQLIFLLLITCWPVAIEYMRTPSNFAPPPRWTASPLATTFFFTTDAPALRLTVVAVMPFLLAGILVRADLRLIARYQNRPTEPPSRVHWTAAVARLLSGQQPEVSPLGKELLVALRFLFLRMPLVFLALTALAAFLFGAPYLLLTAYFWWLPLSTNAVGPDYENGLIRYRLLGIPIATILRWRLVASLVLTVVVVAIAGLLALFAGVLAPPQMGPDHPVMYVIALGYSLTLIALWSVAGDRYSLRYPDAMEMHTLLPDRTRSGGAGAVVTLFFMWIGLIITSTIIIAAAASVVFLAWPGPFDTPRAAAIALLAGAANVAAYLVHTRHFARHGR